MPLWLSAIRSLVAPEPAGRPTHLVPRWLFLRALGLIFLSAFYSYLHQIQGLIGPDGILPARAYLDYISQHAGLSRYWFAPTALWFGSGNGVLQALCWIGIVAALALFLNLWPKGSLWLCMSVFLSFIAASQDFASYQSDGMLLEAGFISLFLVPVGWRPGLGEGDPPSRAALFLLQWEWFRIYFESGLVKLLSGDPHWRHLTAMDDYYQNGPLPTWLGWYAQQRLPHSIHAATTLLTLVVELAVVWALFLPRRIRILCFCGLFFFQVGIILTANYAFLNYIVAALSVFLLDDEALAPLHSKLASAKGASRGALFPRMKLALATIFLSWVFYATTGELLLLLFPAFPLPTLPIQALEPFRFANQYGLFAVMTPARYEIEFQGSRNGKIWLPYLFRYKPQALNEAPGIYAPYQPRFEWNLWFASLGSWRQYPWVVQTEARLLKGSTGVITLFRQNPFPKTPPRYVRAVLWQYWFSDPAAHSRSGLWWRREERGLYAPSLRQDEGGRISLADPTQKSLAEP